MDDLKKERDLELARKKQEREKKAEEVKRRKIEKKEALKVRLTSDT